MLTAPDTADFIASMARELAQLARRAGHEPLAKLFDMAEVEARNLTNGAERK